MMGGQGQQGAVPRGHDDVVFDRLLAAGVPGPRVLPLADPSEWRAALALVRRGG